VTVTATLPSLAISGYRTNQERIATHLREAILSGQLASGTRVTQNELAALVGSSITPVREAVRQLATEGLLRIAPNTSVTVAEPTVQDALDVYEVLMVLEPMAMRKASQNITPGEIAAAEQMIALMEGLDGQEVGRWSLLNCELHHILCAASRSEPLAQAVNTLRRRGTLFVSASLRVPNRRPDSTEEHQAILRALEAGDADLAARLTHLHLQATLTALQIESAT
jgi:DNA-binding GntR family transcriptional regulator